MNEILLEVNKKSYGGWSRIRIQRSLDQIAGSFFLMVSGRGAIDLSKWQFKIGHTCSIKVGNNILVNGYIDDFDINYGRESHNIKIAGRDRTCDLIDCSYVPYLVPVKKPQKPFIDVNEWTNQPLIKIVEHLCHPFGIDVKVDSNTTEDSQQDIQTMVDTFDTFSTEGETIAELITKVCLTRAILPICYGDGNLTLSRAGSRKALDSLVLGKNILSGDFKQSNKDRFSKYVVKGQGKGIDSKTLWSWMNPSYEWNDSVMERSRYRPTIIFGETLTDTGKCMKRAVWECARRFGNSRKVTYEVQGWMQSDGKTMWPLNALIPVKDECFGINDTLLISEIEHIVSNKTGTISKITLVDKLAYELLETPLKAGFYMDFKEGEGNTESPWWSI